MKSNWFNEFSIEKRWRKIINFSNENLTINLVCLKPVFVFFSFSCKWKFYSLYYIKYTCKLKLWKMKTSQDLYLWHALQWKLSETRLCLKTDIFSPKKFRENTQGVKKRVEYTDACLKNKRILKLRLLSLWSCRYLTRLPDKICFPL